MTNQEKYKKVFSALHTSEQFSVEVNDMKKRSYVINRVATAACASLLVIFGSMSVGYAANIGGFRQVVQTWLHGKTVESVVESTEDGSYTVTYQGDGETLTVSGGGVTIDANGEERPVTADEYMGMLSMPEAEKAEDGRIWLYYKDQTVEITDRFQDGICRIQLQDGDRKAYITVEDNHGGGYATTLSENAYMK